MRDQIKQKQQDLSILRSRKNTLSTDAKTLGDLHDRYQLLHGRGHLSYVRLTENLRELQNARGEGETIDRQINQAQSAIAEFKTRLGSLSARQRDEIYSELYRIETEIAQNGDVIQKLRQKVEQLTVRAPVRGIVKGVSVNSVGGVVQPGEDLMSIVPLDEQLVVETRIEPKDIGHIRIGQLVQVKVSAYDVSRYGAIRGHLDFVSATTFKQEGVGRHYKARVLLDRPYVGTDERSNPILPGMTVTAEVITGEKTILDYLLKPVHQAMTTAFSER